MAVEEWVIRSVVEDADGTEPRWLVLFDVPTEYAPDGVYSVSMPKDIVQNYAALYGYDVDDPADMDELHDYILHTAYMGEVDRRKGESAEKFHPYKNRMEDARAAVSVSLAAFKETRAITESTTARIEWSDPLTGEKLEEVGSVVEFIRQETKIDREAFEAKLGQTQQTRIAVAMEMAFKENIRRTALADPSGEGIGAHGRQQRGNPNRPGPLR